MHFIVVVNVKVIQQALHCGPSTNSNYPPIYELHAEEKIQTKLHQPISS